MSTDLVAWLSISALTGLLVLSRLIRMPGTRDLRAIAAVSLLVILAVGTWLSEREAQERQHQLRAMVEGFAPTYANDLVRQGHAKVGPQTPADDPAYLELIDMQRNWLEVNPAVADIYTIRRTAEGKIALIVDSETDYDRDGKFEGDREARTEIGEIYEEADPAMYAALDGKASFLDTPSTDRWGTWVSAFVPMYDESGKVEAVCGVDYHASDWISAAFDARMTVYSRLQRLSVAPPYRSDLGRELALRAITAARRSEAELRLAVEEARAGQRAEAEFLATMSHEIRTPMNGVLGMSELLLDTELSREQRQFSLSIHDSGRHLLHVINQILDFSKGEAGRFELELSACDCAGSSKNRSVCSPSWHTARDSSSPSWSETGWRIPSLRTRRG